MVGKRKTSQATAQPGFSLAPTFCFWLLRTLAIISHFQISGLQNDLKSTADACIKTKPVKQTSWSADGKGHLEPMNQLVLSKSKDTAVTFLYMPCLPQDPDRYPDFLGSLTELTNDWPPTIIVRGVSPVMTTTM